MKGWTQRSAVSGLCRICFLLFLWNPATVYAQIIYEDIDDITLTENEDAYTLFMGPYDHSFEFVIEQPNDTTFGISLNTTGDPWPMVLSRLDSVFVLKDDELVDHNTDFSNSINSFWLRGCESTVWPTMNNVYMAVALPNIDGDSLYGWIRYSFDGDLQAITLHDFAYNSRPNDSIRTGVTVGLPKELSSDFQFSRNNGFLNFSNLNERAVFDIYDIQGKQVLRCHLNSENSRVRLEGCSKGIYIARLQSASGFWTVKLRL